jgi:hypothetical protein
MSSDTPPPIEFVRQGPRSAEALDDPRAVRVRRYALDDHKRRREEPKQSARELFAIADAAREGTPPAGSPAARELREAQERGDFARAREIRAEVVERAPDLDRIAYAQLRREHKRMRRRGA